MMKKITLLFVGTVFLALTMLCLALYKLTPGWTAAVCLNCGAGIIGRTGYRFNYLLAKVPAKTKKYEDTWFKFTVFDSMIVDIDETDNRINISGHILSDGTVTETRPTVDSGIAELVVYGSNETLPSTVPGLAKDAEGHYSLPGYPAPSGEIIPQSFNRVALTDGTIAVIFATKQKIPYANVPGPLNELHAYYAPSQGHLLHFRVNLACSPAHAKRQTALLNLVLRSFEMKSQWKWKTKQVYSEGKTPWKNSCDRFEQLRKSAERMQQREADRKNAK